MEEKAINCYCQERGKEQAKEFQKAVKGDCKSKQKINIKNYVMKKGI